mmetsp:Transcript_15814/g.49710  ORF Transcript_15814/g.49710 Transcript_15814/m.49710 type:complete len:379 (-) Transcript_15814:92-1228(-)
MASNAARIGLVGSLNHINKFEAKDNVKPKHPHDVSRGFEKFAYPKIVRQIRDPELIIRQKALKAMLELLAVGECKVQCIMSGGTEALTECLRDADSLVRERAATALQLVATDDAGCFSMLVSSTVPVLVDMLSDRDDQVRTAVYQCLVEAAHIPDIRRELVVNLPGTMSLLVQKSLVEKVERGQLALELLRCCLQDADEEKVSEVGTAPLDTAMPKGISAMKQLLPPEQPPVVREGAAWVLSLLAVPTTGKTLCVEEKIVGDLIPMLEDPELSLRAAAAGALMSVTIDIYAKAQFQEEGGAGPILQLLEVNDVKLQVHVLQVITNCAEHPVAREELKAALELMQRIQLTTPSSLLERCAAQAIRQVNFENLPYEQLPG